MKIVTWNIRNGGGAVRKDRWRQVVQTLLDFDSDVVVLSEFRVGGAGSAILAALATAGYHLSHPTAAALANTALIASRTPVLGAASLDDALPECRHLWRVELGWLTVVGAYMPQRQAKRPYWEAVLAAATSQPPSLFMGDFNTGTNTLDKDPQGAAFVTPEYMDRVTETGFVDLWRARHPTAREYTWFSNVRSGFRIDHAFGSPQFNQTVLECHYEHGPRLNGISDHSALVVEVA